MGIIKFSEVFEDWKMCLVRDWMDYFNPIKIFLLLLKIAIYPLAWFNFKIDTYFHGGKS